MKIRYPVSALALALSLQLIAPVAGVPLLTSDLVFAGAAAEPGTTPPGPPTPGGPGKDRDNGYRDPAAPPNDADATQPSAAARTSFAASTGADASGVPSVLSDATDPYLLMKRN